MKTKFIVVTPHKALEMLEKNKNNRPINKGLVKRYARDMRNGRWCENGESIVVTETGILVDGQHRLFALVEANVTVTFCVVTVPDKNAKHYDNGRGRTTTDGLRIYGNISEKLLNVRLISAIKMILLRFKFGENVKTNVVSEAEVQEFILQNNHIFSEYAENVRMIKTSSAVTAAFILAFVNGFELAELDRLAEVINSGLYNNELEKGAVYLRNYLINHSKEQGKNAMEDKFLKTQKMLYVYKNGLKNKKFSSKDVKIYYNWID